MTAMAASKPAHFLWHMDGAVAVIRLNRPDRKNPLTFASYAELRDTFRNLRDADDVSAAPAATCTTSSVRWSPWI
jgi:enoyl-CoA hydratase/carnithine racemase